MARFTGPKTKISRRYGVPIFGPSKALERKNYPPGIHGPKGSRRKQSEYAIALGEKQKLRLMYGLMERQFRRYYEIALSRRGVTGETLLQLLETRLDNVVYRLGFANTRRGARQLVGHGHVQVNGRKVDISSFTVKIGDKVTVSERPKSRQLATRNSGFDPDRAGPRLADGQPRIVERPGGAHPVAGGDCADRQRAVDRRIVLALTTIDLPTNLRKGMGESSSLFCCVSPSYCVSRMVRPR